MQSDSSPVEKLGNEIDTLIEELAKVLYIVQQETLNPCTQKFIVTELEPGTALCWSS